MNDLTSFEKDLFKSVKFNNPEFNIKADNLMEWSNDKNIVEKNLEDGEKMFVACGVYVAFKIN